MPDGFFEESLLHKQPEYQSAFPGCGACKLKKKSRHGCGYGVHTGLPHKDPAIFPITGEGGKNIMVVGMCPYSDEDARSRHWVGNKGSALKKALQARSVAVRHDVWRTDALACHPGTTAPTDKQLEYCQPVLKARIEELEPEKILLYGQTAMKQFLRMIMPSTFKINAGKRWWGWIIPDRQYDAWVTCLPEYPNKGTKVARMRWDMMLDGFVQAEGRPWNGQQPDLETQVERIHDPDKAAAIIRRMIQKGGLCAWDWEGTGLKPEYEGVKIISCSICWRGKKTIAYPWAGAAITATKEFLLSPRTFKIASNLQHEERWANKFLGIDVVNWFWDTVLGSVVPDNRGSIGSIKFLGYKDFGIIPWDDHISPYMKTHGSEKVNRAATEIDMDQNLMYNGMDSLIEYMVAIKQMKKIGVPVP